jgi:PAS domain S-box-containing protein
MKSTEEKTSSPHAWLMGESRQAFDRGILAGGAVLGVIVGLDLGLGTIFVTAYPLASVVASAFSLSATIVIWTASMGLAAASALWNGNGGTFDYWMRFAFVAAGGAFAALLAYRRDRSATVSSRLVLLDEIGSTADGSLPLDETIRRALAGIVPAAADFCMIDVVREGTVQRVAVRARGTSRWEEVEAGLRNREPSTPNWLRDPDMGIPAVPYFLPRVTSGHEEILAHDSGEDLAFIRSLGLRSVVIAPMMARGRLLATLTLAVSWSRRRYGSDDLAFARALAGRLAMALENAGLFSDLESVERRMDAVMSKIAEAVTVHDARGRLLFANRTFGEWVGAESSEDLPKLGGEWLLERVAIFDQDGRQLEPGIDELTRLIEAGQLPITAMIRVVTAFDGRERWLELGADAIRGADGDVLYVVTTMKDVTETKRAELSQRVTAEAAELLAMSQELTETLQRVAELAIPELADWCSINLLSTDGEIEQVALAHADSVELRRASELRDRAPARLGDGSILARVIGEERPHRYDVSDPSVGAVPGRLDAARDAGLGPGVTVPIRAGGRVAGTLTFIDAPGRRRFSDSDVALATEMADRAGVFIENARLSNLRRDIADTLQRGLLPPSMPEIQGWEVAAMYHPAGELNEVGGDFYDAFEVENGWMIVVGDVVGRGAKAAALTALARHTINTACTLTGDPREALSLLNRRLLARGDQPLCTAAIVVLSNAGEPTAEADAVVVSAGHPLPLVVRAGGVEEACRPGPMLGALAGAEWQLDLVSLQPGEQLVIYTDGVTDARVGGELFGEERLRAGLAGATSPAGAIDRIESSLRTYAGSEVVDDASAVAIMRARDVPAHAPSPVAEADSRL